MQASAVLDAAGGDYTSRPIRLPAMSPKAPTPKSPAPATDTVGQFEDGMKELETIVQSLERGELRLDESLRLFERGIALARQCRGSLESAELKVHDLLAGDAPADDEDEEPAA